MCSASAFVNDSHCCRLHFHSIERAISLCAQVLTLPSVPSTTLIKTYVYFCLRRAFMGIRYHDGFLRCLFAVGSGRAKKTGRGDGWALKYLKSYRLNSVRARFSQEGSCRLKLCGKISV